VARIVWNSGSYSPQHDGVFAADFGLQFSPDGVTWSAAPEWTVSPNYPYNSAAAANTRFEFSGGVFSGRGFRCAGQVHTSSDATNSWAAFATEVEAYPASTLSPPAPSLRIDLATGGLAISWDGWAANYVLESATNLSPAAIWVSVTNMPRPSGTSWTVSVAPATESQFFRLRLP
jgi:hypothetical protein